MAGGEMTDRELLELAAKAAKHQLGLSGKYIVEDGISTAWNPLEDDGDAFRLMVDVGVDAISRGVIIYGSDDGLVSYWTSVRVGKVWVSDRAATQCASTRRAIVRAAAEIGGGMK